MMSRNHSKSFSFLLQFDQEKIQMEEAISQRDNKIQELEEEVSLLVRR